MLKELDWETPFLCAHGIIDFPANKYIFYRGYETKYPAVANRFAYYGSKRVATGYGIGEGRAVSAFSNSLPLRLLDLRYMKHILREIFESNEPNESALSVILSFGLCSFYHQYQLAKRRFKDSNLTEQMTALQKYYKDDPLFEQSGIRIAETTNDSYTMGFLRGIFSSFADGFLCPSLKSAFHTEKNGIMNAELILFNPLGNGIVECENQTLLESVPINEVLFKQKPDLIRIQDKHFSYTFFMFQGMKGGGPNTHWTELLEDTEMEKGFRAAFEYTRNSIPFIPIERHPKVSVSDWTPTARNTRKNKKRHVLDK